MGGDHADRGRGPSDAMGRTAEDARRGFRWDPEAAGRRAEFSVWEGGREVRGKTETADR